jgi:4-amino-4-deoxy-L-arabinose transferase-like glycosyltransferase
LKNILILCGLAFVFLMLGNNMVSLTNPDEVFYSGSAREMVQQNTWFVPHLFGQPQFEKPILLFWLLRVSFLAFGPTSFGARPSMSTVFSRARSRPIFRYRHRPSTNW